MASAEETSSEQVVSTGVMGDFRADLKWSETEFGRSDLNSESLREQAEGTERIWTEFTEWEEGDAARWNVTSGHAVEIIRPLCGLTSW